MEQLVSNFYSQILFSISTETFVQLGHEHVSLNVEDDGAAYRFLHLFPDIKKAASPLTQEGAEVYLHARVSRMVNVVLAHVFERQRIVKSWTQLFNSGLAGPDIAMEMLIQEPLRTIESLINTYRSDEGRTLLALSSNPTDEQTLSNILLQIDTVSRQYAFEPAVARRLLTQAVGRRDGSEVSVILFILLLRSIYQMPHSRPLLVQMGCPLDFSLSPVDLMKLLLSKVYNAASVNPVDDAMVLLDSIRAEMDSKFKFKTLHSLHNISLFHVEGQLMVVPVCLERRDLSISQEVLFDSLLVGSFLAQLAGDAHEWSTDLTIQARNNLPLMNMFMNTRDFVGPVCAHVLLKMPGLSGVDGQATTLVEIFHAVYQPLTSKLFGEEHTKLFLLVAHPEPNKLIDLSSHLFYSPQLGFLPRACTYSVADANYISAPSKCWIGVLPADPVIQPGENIESHSTAAANRLLELVVLWSFRAGSKNDRGKLKRLADTVYVLPASYGVASDQPLLTNLKLMTALFKAEGGDNSIHISALTVLLCDALIQHGLTWAKTLYLLCITWMGQLRQKAARDDPASSNDEGSNGTSYTDPRLIINTTFILEELARMADIDIPTWDTTSLAELMTKHVLFTERVQLGDVISEIATTSCRIIYDSSEAHSPLVTSLFPVIQANWSSMDNQFYRLPPTPHQAGTPVDTSKTEQIFPGCWILRKEFPLQKRIGAGESGGKTTPTAKGDAKGKKQKYIYELMNLGAWNRGGTQTGIHISIFNSFFKSCKFADQCDWLGDIYNERTCRPDSMNINEAITQIFFFSKVLETREQQVMLMNLMRIASNLNTALVSRVREANLVLDVMTAGFKFVHGFGNNTIAEIGIRLVRLMVAHLGLAKIAFPTCGYVVRSLHNSDVGVASSPHQLLRLMWETTKMLSGANMSVANHIQCFHNHGYLLQTEMKDVTPSKWKMKLCLPYSIVPQQQFNPLVPNPHPLSQPSPVALFEILCRLSWMHFSSNRAGCTDADISYADFLELLPVWLSEMVAVHRDPSVGWSKHPQELKLVKSLLNAVLPTVPAADAHQSRAHYVEQAVSLSEEMLQRILQSYPVLFDDSCGRSCSEIEILDAFLSLLVFENEQTSTFVWRSSSGSSNIALTLVPLNERGRIAILRAAIFLLFYRDQPSLAFNNVAETAMSGSDSLTATSLTERHLTALLSNATGRHIKTVAPFFVLFNGFSKGQTSLVFEASAGLVNSARPVLAFVPSKLDYLDLMDFLFALCWILEIQMPCLVGFYRYSEEQRKTVMRSMFCLQESRFQPVQTIQMMLDTRDNQSTDALAGLIWALLVECQWVGHTEVQRVENNIREITENTPSPTQHTEKHRFAGLLKKLFLQPVRMENIFPLESDLSHEQVQRSFAVLIETLAAHLLEKKDHLHIEAALGHVHRIPTSVDQSFVITDDLEPELGLKFETDTSLCIDNYSSFRRVVDRLLLH